MQTNNNQEQKLLTSPCNKNTYINQTSVSKKVLELECQLYKTEKHYMANKKPYKQVPKHIKFNRQNKIGSINSDVGILSYKIFPSCLNQDVPLTQKSSKVPNFKVKNVFEAYKQILQYKFNKRKRQSQNLSLQINLSPKRKQMSPKLIIEQQKTALGEQLCTTKKYIKKQLQINLPNNYNYLTTTNSRNNSRVVNYSIKNSSNAYYPFNNYNSQKTIDKQHNFIRSPTKRRQQNQSGTKQNIQNVQNRSYRKIDLYQIKRKCHTQQSNTQNYYSNQQQAQFNKTKNITFKLPKTKKYQTKQNHILENERQHKTANRLSFVEEKLKTLSPKPQTISYRVKSLKSNSNYVSLQHNTSQFNSRHNIISKFNSQFVDKVYKGMLKKKQGNHDQYEQINNLATSKQNLLQLVLSKQKLSKHRTLTVEAQNNHQFSMNTQNLTIDQMDGYFAQQNCQDSIENMQKRGRKRRNQFKNKFNYNFNYYCMQKKNTRFNRKFKLNNINGAKIEGWGIDEGGQMTPKGMTIYPQ